jgi:[acyl-carrier-protein] S-malonyltransferase
MKPAQDRLAQDLNSIQFNDPSVPVVCNADAAEVQNAAASKDALIRQVTGAVRWVDCMKLMIAKGINTYVEVGPGKVLCGLMRQIERSKTCMNVGDEASLQKALEQLAMKA